MKLSEKLEWEDLTLEERLYEVEAAATEEYREIHKQAIAEWIAQLKSQNANLLQAVNDKDQELFESQELVGELLEALETIAKHDGSDNFVAKHLVGIANEAIRKAKGEAAEKQPDPLLESLFLGDE